MEAATGGNMEDWTDQAAVVGLWEVLKKYGYFKAQFDRTLAEIARLQPTAVVLIDYPGFNLRLATALRAHPVGRSLQDHLLHQPAGLGLEPGAYPAHGEAARPDDLHFPL